MSHRSLVLSVIVACAALLAMPFAASASVLIRLSNTGVGEPANRLVLDQVEPGAANAPTAVFVDITNDNNWYFSFQDNDNPDAAAAVSIDPAVTFCTASDPNIDTVNNRVDCNMTISGLDASKPAIIYMGDANSISNVSGTESRGIQIYGEKGDDTLNGDVGTDYLFGGEGTDALDGVLGDDQLYGGDGQDELNGNAGHDQLDGGAGYDNLYGDDKYDLAAGTGNDLIEARDGETDFAACGGGNDTAIADAESVENASHFNGCENVQRPAPVTPPTPFTMTVGGVALNNTIMKDTKRFVVFTDGRFLNVFVSFQTWAAEGFRFDDQLSRFNPVYGTPRQIERKYGKDYKDGKWREGDILSHTPNGGLYVGVGASTTFPIAYSVYMGPNKETCLEDAKELRGLPYDQFKQILLDQGCKIDDVKLELPATTDKRGEKNANSGDRCEASKVARDRKKTKVDVVLSIPRKPALQDLRLTFLPVSNYPSFDSDFRYPATNTSTILSTGFMVIVHDRGGRPVNGVTIILDASSVGGGTPEAVTRTVKMVGPRGNVTATYPGAAAFTNLNFRKAGVVEVGAVLTGSNDESICGAGRFRTFLVSDKDGASYTTAAGRTAYRFAKKKGNAEWRLKPHAVKATRQADARFFGAIIDFFVGLFGGKGGAQASQNAANAGVVAGRMAMGGFLDVKPTVGTFRRGGQGDIVASGGGNVIGSGSNKLLANDGAGLLGNDGAGLLANDGGSMSVAIRNGGQLLANDGGGFKPAALALQPIDGPRMQVASEGGVGILSDHGAGVVAAGGGNIVASGGGNIVAGGAGN